MSRSYKETVKKDRVYSAAEVRDHYKISVNTLSNWVVSAGLRPVRGHRPYLFRGAELNRFHKARRARTAKTVAAGEIYCLGCKASVRPDPDQLILTLCAKGRHLAQGNCPECGKVILKFLNETEYDKLKSGSNPNTTEHFSDEIGEGAPACIGISETGSLRVNNENDLLIYAWLIYARRYNDKTIDAHLASIRAFERFHEEKSFSAITSEEADAYRAWLIKGGARADGRRLSPSTLRHRSSHLSSFFQWLAEHLDQKALRLIPQYFALPRAFDAKVIRPAKRSYIDLQRAEEILHRLPQSSLIERRNRAIFALSYLSAMRESALISLRLRHVEVEHRRIFHEGGVLRAKNGKSFFIKWFPRTQAFEAVFMGWWQEVRKIGGEGDDALFPNADCLGAKSKSETWLPMDTPYAVDAVFKAASKILGEVVTPHSARHTIAALGADICRTPEQRKAWSLNLGHENEQITWGNYGHMSDERAETVLEEFEVLEALTHDERNIVIRYFLHEFQRGTVEFEQAKRLVARLEE